MKEVLDEGPFYHGTKAELNAGDLLEAGKKFQLWQTSQSEFCLFFGDIGGSDLGRRISIGRQAAANLSSRTDRNLRK